jgi:predicted RNase H-like HicB family nuclease
MMKISFTYWKESDGKYLGYLNEYPDHWTQGNDLNDLKDHLADLYDLFTSEEIPGIKQVGELEVA